MARGLQRVVRIFRTEGTGSGISWTASGWSLLSGGATLLVAVLLVLILWWWWGAFARLVDKAPQVRMMSTLNVTLVEGKPVRIGRDHLGQASVPGSIAAGTAAAVEHIELLLRPDRNDAAKDRVEIRNVAADRRLWLHFESGFQTFAERFEIPYGKDADTRFRVGNATILLRNVTRGGFDLATTERLVDGSELTRGPYSFRMPPPLMQSLGLFYNGLPDGAVDADVVAAHLGGQSTTSEAHPMQIGLGTVLDWQQLRLVYRDNRLFLAIGRELDRIRYPIAMELLKPGDPATSKPIKIVTGFGEISWTIVPPVQRADRTLLRAIRETLFGAERDPQNESVLRNFIAGRTTYSVTFLPRVPPAGRNPVQRTLQIASDRKIMLQSVQQCVGSPLPAGCPVPIGPLAAVDGQKCATTQEPALRQCWRTTRPLADSGSAALFRPNPKGMLPLAAGPASTLSETVSTKWVTLLLALIFAFFLRPRGVSDRLVDELMTGGLTGMLRTPLMRWFFVLLSLGLALTPEISAVLATYGIGSIQPLTPVASFAVLVVNWGVAGLALMLFAPGASMAVGIGWISITAIAAIGSLTLASLAVDGPTTHWASYLLKHRYLFLDSVPPVVTAIAVASRASVQRAIRAVLLERGFFIWLVRVAPPAVLAVLFGLWIGFGSQTGVSGFQPVEAGKFVTIIFIAAILVGLVSYLEDVRLRLWWPERMISFAAYGAFVGLLFFAPYWRSDFSPVLIVLLLGASVGAIYTVLACINVLVAAFQRREARLRLPLAYRPARGRSVIPRLVSPRLRPWLARLNAPLGAASIIVLVLVMLLFSPVLIGWGSLFLLNVSDLAGDRSDIGKIEGAMGQGRHVPAQRFITWFDTRLPRPGAQDVAAPVARAEYRDLEYHVIRSRTEVAFGNCEQVKSLDPNHRWWDRWLWNAAGQVATKIGDVLQLGEKVAGLCAPFEASDRGEKGTREEIAAEGHEINDPLAPIEIPVAESDSTAAYMLARYGVGMGVALYLAQVLLVLVVLYGLIRIHFSGLSVMANPHLRQFVGVMLAGSIMLYVLQWTLSWSNVLGLLPFMGQPMTWLSAGNSHHFFMALPCLLVILTALRFAGRAASMPRPRTPPHRGRL